MRPIEFVMNSKNLRKPEKGVEWNPTLPALELGSATGFTKGTIIPQKPPADDNLERWRDAAYSFRHTPRVTPLRRTGQLLDGRQPFPYWIMEGLPVIQAQSEEVERGLYLHLLLVEVGSRWPLKSSPSMCRRLCLQI